MEQEQPDETVKTWNDHEEEIWEVWFYGARANIHNDFRRRRAFVRANTVEEAIAAVKIFHDEEAAIIKVRSRRLLIQSERSN